MLLYLCIESSDCPGEEAISEPACFAPNSPVPPPKGQHAERVVIRMEVIVGEDFSYGER